MYVLSVPSLLPLPLFCPKEVKRTGPSAGLCPGDLSPLYLPLPFHLPTACAGEMLEMLEKRTPTS